MSLVFITFASEAEARAGNLKAFAHLAARDGARGNGWSDIFSDGVSAFAILAEQGIQAAFSDDELGKEGTGDSATYTKVVSGEPVKRDGDGIKLSGTWEPVKTLTIEPPQSGAVKVSDGKK